MAENLIATWTLTEDLGAGFGIGTRISTYWDDFAQGYVVYKDVPTPAFGSNLGTSYDSGTFEAAAGTWTGDTTNLTRSSTVAQTGTYSGLYTQPNTVNKRIATQTASLTSGKTYRVSCYVYVPTVNPFGSALTNIRLYTTNASTVSSNEVYIPAIEDVYDTWTLISIDVAVVGSSDTYDFEIRGGGKFTKTVSGICYIDQFLIREINEPSLTNTQITTGPDLGQVIISNVTGYADYNSKWFTSLYQFCSPYPSGTTLVQFRGNIFNPSFPYVYQWTTPNAPQCATTIVVCDLAFIGAPAIVKCSNPYSSDGEIAVGAQSGRGEVRYSLDDVVFNDMTNTTGTFTGLSVGNYTIYARDSANCRATVTVSLTAETTTNGQPNDPLPTYGVMYRMEHDNIYGVEERIDILERNFEGDFVEVKGGPVPFVKSLGSEVPVTNKFECLRPTQAQIQLASERDLQFIGLFSQDDRKYQVRYYEPVGTLRWTGYIVPSIFSEPYTQGAPYITEIRATDNVNQLEQLEFLDKDGNKLKGKKSLIEIIAIILDKLSLQLSIRVGMNITEDTQDNLVPLEQTQHEMSAFYEDDGTPWTCARVIRALLMPFGAKLVQENGVWNIVRIEEQCDVYNTRLYNREGTYVSGAVYDPLVEIVSPSLRLSSIFRDGDSTLEVVPAYGKVTVVRKLFRKETLLENGSFDIDRYQDGIIEGWTVTASEASYKVSKIIRETATDFSNFNLVQTNLPSWVRSATQPSYKGEYRTTETNVDYALEMTGLVDNETITVQSNTIPVELTSSDFFIFTFNYRINTGEITSGNSRSATMPEWVKIRYRIQLGSYYYNDGFWTDDSDYQWNYIFEEEYDKDKKFEIKARLKGISSVTIRPLTITLQFYGSQYQDFNGYSELVAITTTTLPSEGYRIRGLYPLTVSGSTDDWTLDFNLRSGTEALSAPEIIRPTDYATTTNEVVWELTNRTKRAYRDIGSIYLYDVGFKFLPNGEEGPEEEVLEAVNNTNYKENLVVELESGDVTELYVNNKKNLYRNIFLDQAGEPTTSWTRLNVGGTNTLQRLLLSSLVNQYKFPTFKVTGNLLAFEHINFLTTFKQTSEQPSYSLVNGGFTSNINGWSNFATAATDWAYGSNSARVTLSGAVDSEILKQTTPISFTAGDRVRITFDIQRSASSGTRADWLEIKMLNDSTGETYQNLVVAELTSDNQIVRSVRFTITNDCTNIGFRIRNIEGTGSAQYDMNSFEINGQSVVRYFTVNGMEADTANNNYSVNLMQLIPIVPSTDADIDDSGEGNTGTEGGAGGGSSGSGSSTGGDFNSDYNADFYV